MIYSLEQLLELYVNVTFKDGDSPFVQPDYSRISKDIVILPVRRIKLSDIHVNDDHHNDARTHGIDRAHISDLVESFRNGIDISLPLGAVVKNDGTDGKPWKLLYGYHRFLALMELGILEYFFDVIVANPVELALIQLVENESVIPKLPTKEEDIVNTFCRLLEDHVISNNEDSIRMKLLITFPLRKKVSLDRIAEAIFTRQKTPLKFASYTEAKVKLWLEQNVDPETWPSIGGTFDTNRKRFGFVTLQGSLYRTFYRALVKFSETGKKSYMTCHVKSLAGGSTLEEQRMKVVNEYTTVRSHYTKALGKDLNFLELYGFLPQGVDVEPWYKVVPVNQKKINAEVQSKVLTGLPDVLADENA
jgi:hypothetical protein